MFHKISIMNWVFINDNNNEHIFIEVYLQHNKLHLCVYYSPPSSINFFLSFKSILENLMPSYYHSIVMGDFNTCLLKQDSRSTTFKSISLSCELSILPLNATHHIPYNTPSLLDLILISSPN